MTSLAKQRIDSEIFKSIEYTSLKIKNAEKNDGYELAKPFLGSSNVWDGVNLRTGLIFEDKITQPLIHAPHLPRVSTSFMNRPLPPPPPPPLPPQNLDSNQNSESRKMLISGLQNKDVEKNIKKKYIPPNKFISFMRQNKWLFHSIMIFGIIIIVCIIILICMIIFKH